MNGFCPALLRQIEQIADSNAPSKKMHVAGFLALLFCCQNSSVTPLNDGYENGHYRPLTVAYRRRPVLSDVQDEAGCDINRQPTKNEWTLPTLLHRQYGFYISDDLIRQYCVDSSAMVNAGSPPTRVMREVYELIVEGANIVLKAVNQAVVILMATEFGVNTRTGSDTGAFLNISRNGNDYVLDNGVIQMMQDLQENEFCGTPCIAGGGIFSNYKQAEAIACCNAAGMDFSRMATPRFFFDKDTQDIWGANSIGVFAPGSVKFIGRNEFVSNFGGDRGTSFFTTLPLPVEEFGCADDCLRDLVFDLQIKYYDCPFEIEGQQYPRGWHAIISKKFALWVQPTDAFEEDDELAGTNGTLKYFISNTSYSGASYAYPA